MKRLKEPSTWAAFAVLIQMAKAFVPPQHHALVDGVSATAAGLGVTLSEKGKVQ